MTMTCLTSMPLLLVAAFLACILSGTAEGQLRECVLERNTQNCPSLVQKQAPVASCDPDACYNYCNGQFIGCCPKFALSCSIDCPLNNGPVTITAGCRLSGGNSALTTRARQPTRRPTPRPTARLTPQPIRRPTRPTRRPTRRPTSSPTKWTWPKEDLTVGAYYYPWHSNGFHNGDGYLRKQLSTKQEPTLGEYDDTDPNVIYQHLKWSAQANVRLWVTSWWGAGSREDNTTKNVILPHQALGDHKIALFYETTGRIREKDGYSTDNVIPDITYICQTYFQHPNYFRIDGRPVLFVYLTRLLERLGLLDDVVRDMQRTARKEGYDIYIVGDQVFRDAPENESVLPPFALLDAVTKYVPSTDCVLCFCNDLTHCYFLLLPATMCMDLWKSPPRMQQKTAYANTSNARKSGKKSQRNKTVHSFQPYLLDTTILEYDLKMVMVLSPGSYQGMLPKDLSFGPPCDMDERLSKPELGISSW